MLSGCSVFLEKEYLSISPHLEQRTEVSDESWLEADNFIGLKNALIHLIRNGVAQGIIRCYGSYPGDLSRDLPRAIYEVMKEEPIGAYAVEYIPYEAPVHFPAYYEMRISITYSRTPEQLAGIVSTNGLNDFKSAFCRRYAYFQRQTGRGAFLLRRSLL